MLCHHSCVSHCLDIWLYCGHSGTEKSCMLAPTSDLLSGISRAGVLPYSACQGLSRCGGLCSLRMSSHGFLIPLHLLDQCYCCCRGSGAHRGRGAEKSHPARRPLCAALCGRAADGLQPCGIPHEQVPQGMACNSCGSQNPLLVLCSEGPRRTHFKQIRKAQLS